MDVARTRTSRVTRLATALLLTGLASTGCTTQVVERPATAPSTSGELASIAPQLSVERFLQAVNARDFESMRRLFGNHEGPIPGERTEVELRMATIAEVLRHSDYRIVSEQREPGREHPTQRIGVALTIGQRVYPNVPFLVVESRSGGWLIEQIDLEAVTSG